MTWSLGVEEQFYILFPLIVVSAVKLAKNNSVWLFGIIVLMSFAFSEWCTSAYLSSSFFLLPSRAWELGVGTLLAAMEIIWGNSWTRYANILVAQQVAGAIGLFLLAIAVCGFDESAHSPGYVTLFPVIGTVIMIWSESSFINKRVIASAPMVFIGTISYSWYLWHWPIMSDTRIIAVDRVNIYLNISAAILSLFVAILSWRFIERPFRRSLYPSCGTAVPTGCLDAVSHPGRARGLSCEV